MTRKRKRNYLIKPILATSLLFSAVSVPVLTPSEVQAETSTYQREMDDYSKEYISFYEVFYAHWHWMEGEKDLDKADEFFNQASHYYEEFLNENNDYVATLNPFIQDIDKEMKIITQAEYQLMKAEYQYNMGKLTEDEYKERLDKWGTVASEASPKVMELIHSYKQVFHVDYSTDFKDLLSIDVDEGLITYTVVKGNSLFGIAKEYRTTVQRLKELNGLSSDILYIGQVLKVDAPKAPELPDVGEDSSVYKVKKDDTLFRIAREHDLPLSVLKSINGLTDDTIYENQLLLVEDITEDGAQS